MHPPAHQVLSMIFPEHICERIAGGQGIGWRDVAQAHEYATVLFCDVVGFSTMCHRTTPDEIMRFLHVFFSLLDGALDQYPRVHKIETIGDCIVCASGIFEADATPSDFIECASQMLAFANDAVRLSGTVRMPGSSDRVRVRIGIHTGKVTTGIVGTRMPRFTLFGDTVNVAARLQQSAEPNEIVASDATIEFICRDALASASASSEGRRVYLKGIGDIDIHTLQTLDYDEDAPAPASVSELLEEMTTQRPNLTLP